MVRASALEEYRQDRQRAKARKARRVEAAFQLVSKYYLVNKIQRSRSCIYWINGRRYDETDLLAAARGIENALKTGGGQGKANREFYAHLAACRVAEGLKEKA